MGGKSSAPPPPDYAAAAQQTAAGNAEAARIAATANRVDRVNNNGSIKYTQDPNNQDKWTETTTLSPDQQKLYDQDVKIKLGLNQVSDKGLGYVQDALDNPFDKSALPQSTVNAGETGQAAILRRLQPQLDHDRESVRTRLLNQGLTEGSEGFQRGMEQADRQSNDAYSQAALQGINIGDNARSKAIQEQSFFRNEPLNMLNAVRTGQQVSNPTFQNPIAQQATTAGPDLLGAASKTYDAQVANTNAQNAGAAGTMSGLFSLGTAALPYMMSDERLKTDVRRVGELPNGIGIYVFRYLWEEKLQFGCIAQDVMKIMPEAVAKMPTGYYAVNYEKVLA